MKLAKDIGSPSVKVRPNGLPKEVPEEKTLEQIGKSLRECGQFAQDNGVLIQLEVHGSETSRVPRIRKIFDFGGNHPAVKACWNSNQTDLLDGGFEANFKLLKDQIGQVHMRDLYLEEYPFRALISQSRGDEVPGLLLRRDSGVHRWRQGPAVFPRHVPGVSGVDDVVGSRACPPKREARARFAGAAHVHVQPPSGVPLRPCLHRCGSTLPRRKARLRSLPIHPSPSHASVLQPR